MSTPAITYHVDEAGDGVLFGPMGRDRKLFDVGVKKPLDRGFTGPKTRNTRHGAEFCPTAQTRSQGGRSKSTDGPSSNPMRPLPSPIQCEATRLVNPH